MPFSMIDFSSTTIDFYLSHNYYDCSNIVNTLVFEKCIHLKRIKIAFYAVFYCSALNTTNLQLLPYSYKYVNFMNIAIVSTTIIIIVHIENDQLLRSWFYGYLPCCVIVLSHDEASASNSAAHSSCWWLKTSWNNYSINHNTLCTPT